MLLGESPEFSDVELDMSASGSVEIRHMQFTRKSVPDAIKEYFKIIGRPATAQETLDNLIKGGIEFPKDWIPKRYKKNIAIQLGSHPEFVDFEVNGVKAYGLAEKYPDKKKEKNQRLIGEDGEMKKRGMPAKKNSESEVKVNEPEKMLDKNQKNMYHFTVITLGLRVSLSPRCLVRSGFFL